jgi:hypothetical protein
MQRARATGVEHFDWLTFDDGMKLFIEIEVRGVNRIECLYGSVVELHLGRISRHGEGIDFQAFPEQLAGAVPPKLKRGAEQTALRPKALEMLRYLAERRGRLVSKEELLEGVWPGRVVSRGGLRFCMREIRAALGDSPDMPQYLETVTGKGYRFLGGSDGRALHPEVTGPMVGRESELRQLEDYLRLASDGKRQFVLISGEPGIGKTTLLKLFLDTVADKHVVRIARGQCVAQYGKVEAYGPLLEVLTRLCHGSNGSEIIAALQRYAPMWLMQLPGLVDPDEVAQLQRQIGAQPASLIA